MRLFRLFLYFVVGLLLGASSVLAFAGTYAATLNWASAYAGGSYFDAMSACSAGAALKTQLTGVQWVATGVTYSSATAGTCTGTRAGTVWGSGVDTVAGTYSCPNGGTLSAGVCTKSCTAPLTLQADGTCSCGPGEHLDAATNTCVPDDKCAASKGQEKSGWVVRGAGGYGGTVCIEGCNYQQVASMDLSNPQDERIGKDGRVWGPVSQTGLGTTCTAGTADQGQPDQNNKQAKPPVCGVTDGVMTSSSGKVLCVPEGTPDARKPDVEKKTKTETASNGDKVTTESTTTTDPQTNAKQTNTTTTTTTSAGTSVSTSTATSSGNVGTAGGATGGGSCTGENCTDNASKGKFGEYGELWKKKYPDGVSKVVTDKVTEMKQSNLGKLVADLAPVGIGSSGTCPAWTFDANIGHRMNFGSGSYAPPCWLWTALRAVFLITTLFMARRIIFGG